MKTKVSYLNERCDRCGSKRRVARTWKEAIPTFTGKKTVVEYSQIICTNKACQKEFEAKLRDETKKREEIKRKKDDFEAKRKANGIKKSKDAKKNKSRI